MALTKKNAAPAFEDDGDDAVAVAEQEHDEQAAAKPVRTTPKAEAKPEQETVAETGSAVANRKFQPKDPNVVGALKDRLAFPEYGEDTRLIATGGEIVDGDEVSYGKEITLRLISYNDHYQVQPGESGKEAAKLVRHSKDGVETLEGEDMNEYLAQLKEDGYPKASKKKYLDVMGIVEECESNPDVVMTPVLLSVPPSGVKGFNKMAKQLMTSVMYGMVEVPEDYETRGILIKVYVTNEKNDGNNWTQFRFALA